MFFILTLETDGSRIIKKRREIRVDETLFPKIGQGDPEAFEVLYRQTASAVYAYILSILKNTSDAQDVMQDTYLKIRAAAGLYQPQGKPLAWMFTIARNLSFMQLRSREREAMPEEGWMENSLDLSCLDNLEEKLLLEAALRLLSEREHQVVLLHAVAGWKHREIAQYLELTSASAVKIYNRALQKMRKYLREGGVPDEG